MQRSIKRRTISTPGQDTIPSFQDLDGNILTGVALMNLGIARKILGDMDEAISQFQRARSHFEEEGDLARLAEVHHLMGMTFLGKHLSPEAMNEFEQCSSLSLAGSDQTRLGLAFLGKAHVFYERGDLETALSLADRCLNQLSGWYDRMYLADVYKLKIMIYKGRAKRRRFIKREALTRTTI